MKARGQGVSLYFSQSCFESLSKYGIHMDCMGSHLSVSANLYHALYECYKYM